MTRSGRHVALRRGGGIDLVDALGASPRVSIDAPAGGEGDDFAFVGNVLWRLSGDRIDRWALDGRVVEPAIALPARGRRLDPVSGHDADAAVVSPGSPASGSRTMLAHGRFER